MYEIYTDGSYKPATQRGGYASFCTTNGHLTHGSAVNTTNNRMELMAVIAGLQHIPNGAQVTIYSDSQYFVNAVMNNWLKNWHRNNWIKRSDGKPVLNQDLWEIILSEMNRVQIFAVWVKGHAGNHMNELCDKVAQYNAMR